jgi:hypothetical protein
MSIEDELNELLAAFIDDELSDEQKQRLAELVQSDPDARIRYLDHCRMHAALAWEHGVLGGMSFQSAPENVATPSFFDRVGKPLAIAAGIALVIGLIWRSAMPTLRRNAWMSGPTVGSVERSAGGELSVENLSHRLAAGDALRIGGYLLKGGLINLRFENGVEVIVEAPARFRVESATRMVLHTGRLSANVPPAGKGFTVQTPTADVIDHGTEFGVEVSEGFGSEIHVFEGEVEVKSRTVETETLRLFTDQATRVDNVDGSPAGIKVAPDRFLRSFDEPSASYARRVQQLNPVLYLRMAPSNDGRTLADHSGNGLHAQIVSGKVDRPMFGRGRVGSAFRMRGPRAGTHAVVEDYPKTTNSQLSVVAWVRAQSRPRWASIAKNWGEGQLGQFHFGLLDHSGELEIRIRGPRRGGSRVQDSKPFPIDVWQHVAFVADGETLRLYRNGKEVGSTSHRPIGPPTLKALAIGAKLIGNHPKYPGAPVDFWHGRIDEFALFNHALDSETIRELFETGNDPGQIAAKLR